MFFASFFVHKVSIRMGNEQISIDLIMVVLYLSHIES